MNWLKITLASALAVGAIGAVTLANEPTAAAQDVVYDSGPPPEVVATIVPVYHGGYAHYYYGGRWYYRNGGRWGYYRSEPRVLYEHRYAHPVYYHHYYRR